MSLLTAPSQQGDPIALAIVAVLLLILVAALLRKRFGRPKAAPQSTVCPIPDRSQPLAPGAAGQLKLHDVDPKTAAMIMAIVADKMGKPLNELRFISIREVK